MKCIAIDDEPLALEKMEIFINKVPFLELAGSFSNGLDAMEYLKNNKIDLMFLDIQMNDITGIQLLEIIKNKPQVILTTAYDNYAIASYELDVCDYLLKPIAFNRFLQAVNKAYDFINNSQTTFVNTVKAESVKKDFFFVKTEYRMEKVNFADIKYIQGMKDYLQIITTKTKIMTLMSFKEMDACLPQNTFFRVHKSYIVSINYIESIERNRIKIDEQLVPIGDKYKDDFQSFISSSNN